LTGRESEIEIQIESWSSRPKYRRESLEISSENKRPRKKEARQDRRLSKGEMDDGEMRELTEVLEVVLNPSFALYSSSEAPPSCSPSDRRAAYPDVSGAKVSS